MLYNKEVNSSGEGVSSVQAREITSDRTIEEQKTATILQRIAAADKTAVEECINKHGGLIWALAKHFTDSREEAEAATQEIFLDIWKLAERFDSVNCEETDFIVLVVRRWLIKRKIESALASVATSSSG